jgi:hypothetical protein
LQMLCPVTPISHKIYKMKFLWLYFEDTYNIIQNLTLGDTICTCKYFIDNEQESITKVFLVSHDEENRLAEVISPKLPVTDWSREEMFYSMCTLFYYYRKN